MVFRSWRTAQCALPFPEKRIGQTAWRESPGPLGPGEQNFVLRRYSNANACCAAFFKEHHYIWSCRTESHNSHAGRAEAGAYTQASKTLLLFRKMPATTPIARSKSAALTRVLDSVTRGYTRYTLGEIAPEKVGRLIAKFHALHGIAATPAERITRKKNNRANAILALYWPDEAQPAAWALLFTEGELGSPERLRLVTDKPRVEWLGYELVRHAARGATAWTWRRSKGGLSSLYTELDAALRRGRFDLVREILGRAARQPGFHGVREQTWQLGQHAIHGGYGGEPPRILFLRKVSHGERVRVPESRP